MRSFFGILSMTGPMAASARVRRPGVAVTLIGSALLFSAGLYLGMHVACISHKCVCACVCLCVCVVCVCVCVSVCRHNALAKQTSTACCDETRLSEYMRCKNKHVLAEKRFICSQITLSHARGCLCVMGVFFFTVHVYL
jgi:hypothetical protein